MLVCRKKWHEDKLKKYLRNLRTRCKGYDFTLSDVYLSPYINPLTPEELINET